MKKLLTICFAVLYTLITSGFTVNMHYCMGELAAVDLHDTHSDACPKCGMDVKGDCCKDEAKFVKLDNSHQAAKAFVELSATVSLLPAVMQPIWLAPVAETVILTPRAHGPPITPSTPLYMSNCIFLI
ncbi:HYC_CC_PP family protein [Chitinophaga niabensis]|uniref:Uncharacterized protein n=1 Tax=Chitinophaga niabensis TaxID=536979 RepID=A0A1N6KDK0_9BACT|nr:hypothetical protein [Chitinophaga niabensis]SIO54406.1 hypothetical protein SAMN04488055_5596 [Chitinophaga niabensis]